MRSPFTHSLTLFILFLLLLVSCRKEIIDAPFEITPITLAEAQQYYEQSPMNQHSSARTQGITGRRKDLLKRVRWNKAVTKKMGDTDVLVVPLRHEMYLVPRFYEKDQPVPTKPAQTDKGFGLDELSRLYFYKDKKGKIQAELVTALPNQDWSSKPYKPFSGYVLVEDERMEFKKGLLYKEGKIINVIESGESKKNGRSSAVTAYCGTYTIPLVQQVYTIKPDGSHSDPTWSVYDWVYIPIDCADVTLGPVISGGWQANYDVTSGSYNPLLPPKTEEEIFKENFRVEPPKNVLKEVAKYLECFSNSTGSTYSVAISIDQPYSGSVAAFNLFASDKHMVGHTFLTFTQVQSNGQTIQRSIGFYPEYGGDITNPNVTGVFVDDSHYSNEWDVQLTFHITGSEMMHMINFTPQYANKHYDLNNRNCGNFALDALSQIGINTSGGWMNTFWTATTHPYSPNSYTEIRGPSIGALGEQLYNNPPSRATSKSRAGGNPPPNKGTCN